MAAVRAAIKAYMVAGIAGSDLPGLNKFYKAQPIFLDPSQWWILPPELGSGSIAYLHLAKITEDRIAKPYVAGQKMVEYQAVIVVIYRYLVPSAAQTPELEGDEWVDGFDATLQGFKDYVHIDPRLGTDPALGGNGVIWQAGQSPGDLGYTLDLPVRDEDAGEVLSIAALEMHVTEVITA